MLCSSVLCMYVCVYIYIYIYIYIITNLIRKLIVDFFPNYTVLLCIIIVGLHV